MIITFISGYYESYNNNFKTILKINKTNNIDSDNI